MDSANQEQFIGNIRSALGYPAKERRSGEIVFSNQPTEASLQILDRIKKRTTADRQKLVDLLLESAEPINLNVNQAKTVSEAGAAICELAKHKNPEWGTEKKIVTWRHPLVERLGLEEKLTGENIDSYVIDPEGPQPDGRFTQEAREKIRQKMATSFIGITAADFCMADTATLVMRNRAGQPRSVAVVPSIHVAVIEQKQVIADLKELYALLKWDPEVSREGLSNYMSYISGPSKTADIEATLVHGAHGPREVHLFVIGEGD